MVERERKLLCKSIQICQARKVDFSNHKKIYIDSLVRADKKGNYFSSQHGHPIKMGWPRGWAEGSGMFGSLFVE